MQLLSERVRLNWFSPLPPERTEIANYTKRLLPYLTELVELQIFTGQECWEPEIEQLAPVRSLQQPVDALIRPDDINVFHLGNNAPFHGLIWNEYQRRGGVLVQHDPVMHHFFAFALQNPTRLHEYFQLIDHWYGQRGVALLTAYLQGDLTLDDLSQELPLTEQVLQKAQAVILHNPAQVMLAAECPLYHLPLPYALPQVATEPDAGPRDTDCRELIVFGFLQPNRRLESILAALGSLPTPLRPRFRLQICGEVWDPAQVKDWIQTWGLTEQVQLRGFLPEAELDQAIARADLALNLRYPSMGEASASQLRIWAQGTPSLVTAIGWYGNLPAGSVVTIPADPDREVSQIQQQLIRLWEEPAFFRQVGRQGRSVLRQHDPERYCRQLVDLIHQLPALQARGQQQLSDYYRQRVVDIAQPWTTSGNVDAVLRNVVPALADLSPDAMMDASSSAPDQTQPGLSDVLLAPVRSWRSRLSLTQLFFLLRKSLRVAQVHLARVSPRRQAVLSRKLDAYLADFEQAFRGSEETVQDSLTVYLPFLEQQFRDFEQPGLFLDLGCGRGEWLSLLGDYHYGHAYGIDLNPDKVEICRAKGLDARCQDALLHLQKAFPETFRGITAFHLVEHLPFSVLLELVEEAYRVLEPGGLLILETPNPENVIVGSHSFFLDPTHRHPLPPVALQFLLRRQGFAEIEMVRLHPEDPEHYLPGDEPLIRRFNNHFYGARDYALVATKPREGDLE